MVSEFLPPRDLARLFRRTLLNVHPALYEAFGMTAVEAAAFGAPTLFHSGKLVGARFSACRPHAAARRRTRAHAGGRQGRSGAAVPFLCSSPLLRKRASKSSNSAPPALPGSAAGATATLRPEAGEALELDLSPLGAGGPAAGVAAARAACAAADAADPAGAAGGAGGAPEAPVSPEVVQAPRRHPAAAAGNSGGGSGEPAPLAEEGTTAGTDWGPQLEQLADTVEALLWDRERLAQIGAGGCERERAGEQAASGSRRGSCGTTLSSAAAASSALPELALVAPPPILCSAVLHCCC